LSGLVALSRGKASGYPRLTVSGVRFETLQSLAGATPFASSGRFEISYPLAGLTNADNFFGMASQSLGTFAIGQRLVPTDF
jgi:hypothetical protein